MVEHPSQRAPVREAARGHARAPLVPSSPHRLPSGAEFGAEFAAALVTWGGIGWLLDQWLGTDPWVMLAGFLLGNGCGLYLMALHSRQDPSSPGPRSQRPDAHTRPEAEHAEPTRGGDE